MASSKHLRENINQHKPKNKKSKVDDKEIYKAMNACILYLRDRFKKDLKEWDLVFEKRLYFKDMINAISNQGLRSNFEKSFGGRCIIPDGGVIVLRKKGSSDFGRLVLASEVKRQGTNDERAKEGKQKQSIGNAVERLGKNLTGIRAMMSHEKITPFVCFGWGCDFVEDYTIAKASMLNEFYKINKIYVHKRDGSSDKNHFAPVSIFFREKRWTKKEMFEILKEIGEDSIRYYLH